MIAANCPNDSQSAAVLRWQLDRGGLSERLHCWMPTENGLFAISLCAEWMFGTDFLLPVEDLLPQLDLLDSRCPDCARIFAQRGLSPLSPQTPPRVDQVDWIDPVITPLDAMGPGFSGASFCAAWAESIGSEVANGFGRGG